VQNSSLFNGSFLAENYEELPDYGGTEVPKVRFNAVLFWPVLFAEDVPELAFF
jgi:hypothetical protein